MRTVVKGSDRADVGQVATKFREEKFLDIGVDFGGSASS